MIKLTPEMTEEDIRRNIRSFLEDSVHLIVPGLYTFFTFEGEEEVKMFMPVFADKLVDLVYKNLQTLADRGWDATLLVENGVVIVFFGSDIGMLQIPPILVDEIKGSC